MNTFSRLIKRSLPPIRIHTWGGYGSQLYGVYLAHNIGRRFPSRRIKIMVHTSAISRMRPDIIKYDAVSVSIIDDFQESNLNSPQLINLRRANFLKSAREFLYKLLVATRFASRCNSDSEISKLKPWVAEIRGHYTRFQFDPKDLLYLYEKIRTNSSPCHVKPCDAGIQYRLGDLVSLESKNPVSPETISSCVSQMHEIRIKTIELHSDSPILASELIRPLISESIEIEILNLEADQIIVRLVQLPIFIGTSAKISVWIALFRVILFEKSHTFMPQQFFDEFKSHGISEGINYY